MSVLGLVSAMDLTTGLILLFVFCVAYYFLLGSRRGHNLPPGPPTLPILGSTRFLRQMREDKKRRPPEVMLEQAKIYGPIVTTRLFNRVTVFLFGYDAIHQAFVKQGDVFSDRPHELLGKNNPAIRNGKGVIWQSGSPWKMMRRFTLQTLRDFGVGKTSLEEKILEEGAAISACLTAARGEPVNIRPLMAKAITNVIYGINFGTRFDFEDPKFSHLIEQMDILFTGTSPRGTNPLEFLPAYLVDRLPLKQAQAMKRRRVTVEWVRGHIQSQIDRHKETYDGDNIRDFVDLYIQTSRSDKQVEDVDGLTEGNLFRVIMDLFIAGSETTSNTLNWSILYMLQYPEVQSRCQAEIDEVAPSRKVQWSDRKACPYVEATLMEIQRLSNIAPLSLPHTTRVDTTLLGYDIPKGTIVQANLISANMDPKHWTEPDKFNPQRFLTDENTLKKTPAFIPFSTGPRVCLGESLARMEMFVIFSNLLQQFTFSKEDRDLKLDFTPLREQFTSAPQPYTARAISRDH